MKLQLIDDQLQVLVDDNGAGSARTYSPARQAGHIGLRALGGLLADAAELEVRARRRRWAPVSRLAPSPRSVDLALAGSAVVSGGTIRDGGGRDHAVVRSGLEQYLATTDDITLVGAARRTERRRSRWCIRPDVVIMDLSMPVMDTAWRPPG
ncbi:MAG: hypothetical protein R2713_13655 [Ilumatobacteraceae bacterium]